MIDNLLRKYSYFLIVVPISLLALVLSIKGITFTYDSINFLCGASSFKVNGRVLMCDDSCMILSPPGFSIYLSLFLTKSKAISGIYVISSLIVYGLTLLCWILIIKVELEGTKFSGLAILLLTLGLPLFYIHLFLWSEGIFLLLFSFGIYSLINYNKSFTLKWLLFTSFFFGISITIRYAGIILFILFFIGWINIKKSKLNKEQFLVLIIPLMVTAYLLSRNFFLGNTFFGERLFINRNFIEVLKSCSKEICKWIIPVERSPDWLCILILALVFFLITSFNKARKLWLFPLFGYVFFIAYSAYRTDIEYDERLFVPVFPIFILSVFKSLSQLPKSKLISWITWILLVYWTLYSSVRLAKNIFIWI